MLAYLMVLFLAGTVHPFGFNSDLGPSLDSEKCVSQPLPQNYTKIATFETTYQPKRITYSPNENWIVYMTTQPRFQNVIFSRNTSMQTLSSEKQVRIGEQNKIVSFAFSQSGDLLFVGTDQYCVFVCKFSGSMGENDCLQKKCLSESANGDGIIKMRTNFGDKIVATDRQDEFWVLGFNSDGDLTIQDHIQFEGYGTIDVMWHPLAEKDNLIISRGIYSNFRAGFIMLYDITLKTNHTLADIGFIYQIVVLKDGKTLLATLYNQQRQQRQYKLIQFNLSTTDITQVGIVVNQDIRIFWTSIDGKTVAGWNRTSGFYKFFVWSVVLPDTPLSPQDSPHFHISTSPTITFKLLYKIGPATNQGFSLEDFSFSTDLNNVLYIKDSRPYFYLYSLCLDNTFFKNMQCLKCSPVCQSCHISPDLCFQCIDNTFALIKNGSCVKCSTLLDGCLSCSNSSSCSKCIDNTFALMNQSCLKCSSVLDGCLTCSTPSFCTLCDYQKNWNALPQNGSCVCQDFYFISQGQCKSCDSSGACRMCTSQTQCTQCDLYKGYKEKPVDSKCVCRNQFSLFNETCIECDIEGCERCEKANVCSLCSEENGYDSDAGSNGECIKKSSFSIIMVWSIIGGCSILLASIYVYCKCKGQRKFQRNELKEESYIEDQGYKQILSGESMDHERASVKRESVPRFEQIEQILRQSIKKQIKVELPIVAVNKKEYAKFSDAQKIRLRQLLQQSLVSNQ